MRITKKKDTHNTCALAAFAALLKLSQLSNLSNATAIRQRYEKHKQPKDNTVNSAQMKIILDGLGINYQLKTKSKNVSTKSLIYLRYKKIPNGVKHWVFRHKNKIYDNLADSPMDVESFYEDNPTYCFSRALNIKLYI